jgi:hypothetical protein
MGGKKRRTGMKKIYLGLVLAALVSTLAGCYVYDPYYGGYYPYGGYYGGYYGGGGYGGGYYGGYYRPYYGYPYRYR